MLTSGDIVQLDFGLPTGSEAGFPRPAVIVTAQRVLDARPTVVHMVPLTSTVRGFASEVAIEPDAANTLESTSAAQCQHIRAVSAGRIGVVMGNVGVVNLAQIRELIGTILDIAG